MKMGKVTAGAIICLLVVAGIFLGARQLMSKALAAAVAVQVLQVLVR